MNFMQKTTLAAGIALTLGVGAMGAAQAASIDVTTMEFYDANGNPQFFGGGLNTTVSGSVNDAVTGVLTDGGTPFFGTPWVANQVMWNDTVGAATWSGTSAAGAYNYTYNLAAGQSAVGLYFTWGAASQIAVLQIFGCAGTEAPGTACPGINSDPLHPAVPGSEMVNGPFAGQHATFKGVSAVPVPAAAWLFGSGLLGLIGIARRRKQA